MRADKRVRLGWGGSGAAILVLLLIIATGAQARGGALDPTFGSEGRVHSPFKTGGGVTLTVAPDGSIVLAHDGRLRRYRTDGTLDVSWGSRGQVFLPRDFEGLRVQAGSVHFDSKGRLLSFSSVSDPERLLEAPANLNRLEASWVLLRRLDSSGNLDSSFGNGKGFVRTDFGLRSSLDASLVSLHSQGLVDQQDRPVLLVRVGDLGGRCTRFAGRPDYTWYPRAVVRLTTSGDPDRGFGGGDGIADVSGEERASTIALDRAGVPVASAGASNCRGSHVFRFREDGTPLSTFGTAGSRVYPDFRFSLLDPNGGMILSQEAGLRTSVLARTNLDGDLDSTFGRRGRALVTMPSGIERELQPVAVDAKGRVLLVGCLSVPVSSKGRPADHRQGSHAKRRYRDFVVIGRFSSRGKPDRTFGMDGWIATRFSRHRDISIEDAVLDGQGRLLVLVRSGSAHILTRYLLKG